MKKYNDLVPKLRLGTPVFEAPLRITMINSQFHWRTSGQCHPACVRMIACVIALLAMTSPECVWSQEGTATEGDAVEAQRPDAVKSAPEKQPSSVGVEKTKPRGTGSLVKKLLKEQGTAVDLNPLQKILDGPPAGADAPWMKDPFKHLEGEMEVVVTDLAGGEVKKPAEEDQPRILSELELLVKMLERSCSGSGSGSGTAGGNPTRPANSSTLAQGPGGTGDLRDPKNSRRKWADLTPKERQKILQSQTGEFPAGFEQILEDYYRQLATDSTDTKSTESSRETDTETELQPE